MSTLLVAAKSRHIGRVAMLWVVLVMFSAALPGCATGPRGDSTTMLRQGAWVSSELYFGLGRADGGTVTEAQWSDFLKTHVVPRFPDGLTVIPAMGSYRGADGVVRSEGTRVLVVVYPVASRAQAVEKIRTISDEYCRAFAQECVLHVQHPVAAEFLMPASSGTKPAP